MDRRTIRGPAYQAVRRALTQSEVPLEVAELVDLPVFATYVEPQQAVFRVLYELKAEGIVFKRPEGTWEIHPDLPCAECGDERADFRKQWDSWLCDHCHGVACDEAEGDRAFDLKHDR